MLGCSEMEDRQLGLTKKKKKSFQSLNFKSLIIVSVHDFKVLFDNKG